MKHRLLLLSFFVTYLISGYSQVDSTKIDSLRISTADTYSTSNSSIGEGQDNDDNSSSNFVPSMLQSSRDIYVNNTSYTFSIAFFRSRGYDNKYHNIYLNGFNMNSLVTGRATFSQWGGLNHVVRYPDTKINMSPASFTFGGIGGVTNYNLRGSAYAKQIKGSYSLSNRTYNN
ncbi:MAG: hypothetical protein CVU04_02870, partial [Bacteroidetes bacterium HGW-Bacteroidetes-20]